MELKDKVFVVTGAGSGMGRQLCIQLVEKGAEVAMIDLNEKTLKETENLIGSARVSTHVLNVTDKENVDKLPESIISKHGVVDAIINNAGIIQPFIRIKDLDFDVIDRIFDVNLKGTLYMTKAFLPHLLKRPEAHITNVSSMAGFIPFPGQAIYSASKAAVKSFTEALYSELKDTTVGVTVIHPGAIDTNITTNSGIEAPSSSDSSSTQSFKALPAKKAAEIIIAGIQKNKFRVLVGSDAKSLDKLYRLSPRMAINMITNKMRDMLPK